MFFKQQTDKKDVFIHNANLSNYDKKVSKTTPTVNISISAYDKVVSLVTSDDSVAVKQHDETNKKVHIKVYIQLYFFF